MLGDDLSPASMPDGQSELERGRKQGVAPGERRPPAGRPDIRPPSPGTSTPKFRGGPSLMSVADH